MKIKIKLKHIIRYDQFDKFGIDPYCLNLGANGEDYIEVKIDNKFMTEAIRNIKKVK